MAALQTVSHRRPRLQSLRRTLAEARFSSITTQGDGAVGIQISRKLPHLTITGNVNTEGGQGLSLIRGRQVPLQAIALSVTHDGHIGTPDVIGQLHTVGDDVITLDVHYTIDDTVITAVWWPPTGPRR